MNHACDREWEVIDAIQAGRCNDEMTTHIASCESCNEIFIVAGALLEDGRDAMRKAPVPTSGTMWWKMKMRSRREAAIRAERTLTWVQAGSLLVAVVLGFTLIGTTSIFDVVNFEQLTTLVKGHLPLMLGLMTSLLLAPVVLYFAFTEER